VAGITDAGLKPRPMKVIAVLGGGLMGSGIATAAAQAGCQVLLKEINQKFLDVRAERYSTRIVAESASNPASTLPLVIPDPQRSKREERVHKPQSMRVMAHAAIVLHSTEAQANIIVLRIDGTCPVVVIIVRSTSYMLQASRLPTPSQ